MFGKSTECNIEWVNLKKKRQDFTFINTFKYKYKSLYSFSIKKKKQNNFA